MRTRTFLALLIVLVAVLVVGMSAHGRGHHGIMRRLATAIHGSHGGSGR